MAAQIPLPLALTGSATFDTFVAGANGALVETLRRGSEPFVYLAGGAGSGKSHLLQAACHAAHGAGGRCAYLPLGSGPGLAPEVLEGLEALELVCLDELEAVAGDPGWERALFRFYNAMRERGGRLYAAARAVPDALDVRLPDLASRLAWGPVFRLHPLADADLARALVLRARARGLELPPEVADYLLRRCPREPAALFALLERLDEASLAAQRRLTIPFVRRLLPP